MENNEKQIQQITNELLDFYEKMTPEELAKYNAQQLDIANGWGPDVGAEVIGSPEYIAAQEELAKAYAEQWEENDEDEELIREKEEEEEEDEEGDMPAIESWDDIPEFDNDEDAAEFFNSHSFHKLFALGKAVHASFPNLRRTIFSKEEKKLLLALLYTTFQMCAVSEDNDDEIEHRHMAAEEAAFKLLKDYGLIQHVKGTRYKINWPYINEIED